MKTLWESILGSMGMGDKKIREMEYPFILFESFMLVILEKMLKCNINIVENPETYLVDMVFDSDTISKNLLAQAYEKSQLQQVLQYSPDQKVIFKSGTEGTIHVSRQFLYKDDSNGLKKGYNVALWIDKDYVKSRLKKFNGVLKKMERASFSSQGKITGKFK